MRRSLTVIAGLALLVLPFVAVAGETTVKVSHSKLKPAEVTIGVGDKVNFVHTVVMLPGGHVLAADDGSFKGEPLVMPGSTWPRTFDMAGTFPYRILQHPGVRGTITVK
ncbi:MAG: hypothetical protein V3V55_08180 [Rhodospirillales bacterium]